MTAKVLVVDDVPANIKLLEAKLNKEYYDVLTAKSGKEAIEVAQNNSLDVILLDVMMPEMDGFEVCRLLKSDPKTAFIPVIMVTALSEVEDRVTGLKAGADDFLTKPVNDMALFARIRSLVRLKIITDELRLRDQTGSELGISEEYNKLAAEIINAKIAIINDDIVESQRLSGYLVKIGHNCEIFSDPKMASEQVINGGFDLIIISTQLSDSDGLRIASHFRSNEYTRSVPILIIVDEEDSNSLVKGLDMGVNDYLFTPMDANELIARVSTQVKRKRYHDALKYNYQNSLNMAITDSLTGVFNRRYFDAHFKTIILQAKNQMRNLSVLLIDIDHFKSINDTYGHLAGDEILRLLPKIVSDKIRVTDFVARYGGEEFIVVMQNTNLYNAKEVGERIRMGIEQNTFNIGENRMIKVTVSVGVAALEPEDTMITIVERADKGLYKAKESGRNQVVAMEL